MIQFHLRQKKNGFIVKIEFSYILDLKKEFDQYKNEQRVVIQQMQQQILELKKSLPDQNQGPSCFEGRNWCKFGQKKKNFS